MIDHEPSLVILSTTIAMLGAFTAAVMTSNIGSQSKGEARMRIIMAALSLGGSIWAMHFVGLLAIDGPLNLGYNPLLLALSGLAALCGTTLALFLRWPRHSGSDSRAPFAVAVLGLTIAATNYLGIGAVAGSGLRLSWFLALISLAVSVQAALIILWFLFRRRGVIVTLAGAIGLGLCVTATHYLAIASADGLDRTLFAIPRDTSGISERYLAWAATIMVYLICSICLSVFVIMQFREEIE
jgi:NO-binding membrane sensor protein with MHYT domain